MPAPPDWLLFFRRPFPSANMVVIRGARPILVDTGFGSDARETEHLLRAAGIPPEQLALIVNTHYHCDHAGGNHSLQRDYGIPIAAHAWDGALINRRDRGACAAEWLDQPVEPYRVDLMLDDGDVLDAGGVTLRVLHTPGHTLGHIALHAADDQVAILGDTAHADDVAWLNPFREGAGALDRAESTVARLAALGLRWACSGHGPAMTDPPAALAAAAQRLAGWRAGPERLAWHAMKRIFAYALMILPDGGLDAADVAPYLLDCPWFADFSRYAFDREPAAMVQPLLDEMLRSGAARWQNDRLVPGAPFRPPAPGWLRGSGHPRDWPATLATGNGAP